MMDGTQTHAADALLNNRLKIILPAPWIFRVFGKKTVPVWIKLPTGQTLVRMARLFTRMNLDLKELKAGNLGNVLECIGQNGVTVSRVIAHGMVHGTMASWLLNRPLAWYLRCYMDMKSMAELTHIIVLLSTAEAFINIITSVATLNMMEPMESQTKQEGS